MTDILIQFHAVPDELAAFVREVTAEVPAHMTAFRFFPFSTTLVGVDTVEAAVLDASVRELAFTLDEPRLPVATANEFLARNPSALRLDIGRLSEHGLNESCLSARTSDEAAMEAWRKVARRLRKVTQAGAVGVNSATGATSRLKNHRFTVGAKALDERGVTIRPVAGSAVLHLGGSK